MKSAEGVRGAGRAGPFVAPLPAPLSASFIGCVFITDAALHPGLRRARARAGSATGTSHKGEALSSCTQPYFRGMGRLPVRLLVCLRSAEVDGGPDVFGERLRTLHVSPRPSLVVVQSSPQKIGATQLLYRLHGRTGIGATNA